MYVRLKRARPCAGFYPITSFTNSSLLLLKSSTCLVCLTWMVLEMGSGRTADVLFLFFFVASKNCSIQRVAFLYNSHQAFLNAQIMHPFSNTDTAILMNKSSLILSGRSDFHMIDNLPIAIHHIVMRMFTSLSVDEILLSKYVNWSLFLRMALVLNNPRKLTTQQRNQTKRLWCPHLEKCVRSVSSASSLCCLIVRVTVIGFGPAFVLMAYQPPWVI